MSTADGRVATGCATHTSLAARECGGDESGGFRQCVDNNADTGRQLRGPSAGAPVPHSPAAQSANPGQSLDFPEPHFLISKNGILIPNRAARTSERIQDFNQLRKVLGPR